MIQYGIKPTRNRDFFFANEGPCGNEYSQLQVTVEGSDKIAIFIVDHTGEKSASIVINKEQQRQLVNLLNGDLVTIPPANISTRKD